MRLYEEDWATIEQYGKDLVASQFPHQARGLLTILTVLRSMDNHGYFAGYENSRAMAEMFMLGWFSGIHWGN